MDGEPASKQRRLGGGVDDTDFSMASLARGVVKEVGTLDPVKDYITLLGRGEDIAVGEWVTQCNEALELSQFSPLFPYPIQFQGNCRMSF